MDTTCTIKQLDQATGDEIVLVEELRCSEPAGFDFRIARAGTTFEIQQVIIYTEMPENNVEIKEGMRVGFKDGQDLRVQSINRWPIVYPIYLELLLQRIGA